MCIIANDWKTLDANAPRSKTEDTSCSLSLLPKKSTARSPSGSGTRLSSDWFGEHLHLITEPSMRNYVKAYELKESGIDWPARFSLTRFPRKHCSLQSFGLTQLFRPNGNVFKRFAKQGGGSHETWYRYKRKLKAPSGPPPRIELKHTGAPSAITKRSSAVERGPELRVIGGLG